MKVVFGYPPLESAKGVPQLSQNRQFQWTPGGFLAYSIYPVVLASAATLLKSNGQEIIWLDGLAEKWTYQEWLGVLKKEKPDLLVIETKTPVVKRHWKIINELKSKDQRLKTILVGDHVTALPRESFENSKVDYILTGGDYDFLLLNLVNHLTKGEKLEPGVYFASVIPCTSMRGYKPKLLAKRAKEDTTDVSPWKIYYRTKNTSEVEGPPEISGGGTSEVDDTGTGKFVLKHDLDQLPFIDRDLTKWRLYAFKNSNFYRTPGAYTMFGRDCWWGKCTFCSWTTLYPAAQYQVVSPKRALDEIGHILENYPVREIMDDSGTFPVGDWLQEFCQGMIGRGYHRRVKINCNLRFNSQLREKDYQLMGKAGFRFLLYGLESASQVTLDRLNKNLKIEQVEPVLRLAKKSGLMPHLTVMVGYPWEEEKDLERTMNLTNDLFQRGLVDSMQATIVIPYPGTPLFNYCQKRKLLITKDWNRYDMCEPIIRTLIPKEKLLAAIRQLYSRSIWNPRFILKTISHLKSIDGIKYVGFQALKYFGKLREFKELNPA